MVAPPLFLIFLLSLGAAAQDAAAPPDPGVQQDAAALIVVLTAGPGIGTQRKALESLINLTPGFGSPTRLKALDAYTGVARSGAAPLNFRVRAIDAMVTLQPTKEEPRLREEGARPLVGLARSDAVPVRLRHAALDALPDFVTDSNEREVVGLFLEIAASHAEAFAPETMRLSSLGHLGRPIADGSIRLRVAETLLTIMSSLSEPVAVRILAIGALAPHVDAATEGSTAVGLGSILGDGRAHRVKEERQAALRAAGQIKWLTPQYEQSLAMKVLEILGDSGEPEILRASAAKTLPRLSTPDNKPLILQTLANRCGDNSSATPAALRTASCASARNLAAP